MNIRDYAVGTVETAPSPATTGTSLTLGTGEGANMPDVPFYVTGSPPNELPTKASVEKLNVTAVSGDTLTIERAQGDTTAKSIAEGWIIANSVFAEAIESKITGEGTAKITYSATAPSTPADGDLWVDTDEPSEELGSLAFKSTVDPADINTEDTTDGNGWNLRYLGGKKVYSKTFGAYATTSTASLSRVAVATSQTLPVGVAANDYHISSNPSVASPGASTFYIAADILPTSTSTTQTFTIETRNMAATAQSMSGGYLTITMIEE